ncbi:hypothetical protein ACH47B_30975 [Rhodococcus sp. NPDC019627]
MDALQMAHEFMMWLHGAGLLPHEFMMWLHGAGILPHMPMHMMPM